jgi:hypothetical protein
VPITIPHEHSIPHDELAALEERVRAALVRGDSGGLDVLGYGEVSLVLRLRTDQGSYACKRLPVFPTRERFERYSLLLAEYLRRLEESGVQPVATSLWHTPLPDGRIVGYCVQEALPAERLCVNLLRQQDEAWAEAFCKRLFGTIEGAISPALGLDAQLSNWADIDGQLVYLDVTTPLLRDQHGRERLDLRLFFSSLPWLLRDPVRLTMSGSIIDKYYQPRGAILDFLGNLHKEGLARFVPAFLAQANAGLDRPITADEVTAYYRGDARMWELLQRLRRADRFWHRAVRRRTYPFLLPPAIER